MTRDTGTAIRVILLVVVVLLLASLWIVPFESQHPSGLVASPIGETP
jgi:hypothetical protein